MNFLLITLEYPPFKGGIAHYYANLVKYLPAPVVILDNSQRLLLDERRRFLKWWPALDNLKTVIKEKKIDYLLVGQILPLGTVAWLLSFVLDCRYSVFLHGYDLSLGWSQQRKRWLIKAILNKADKIICANSYTDKEVKKIIKATDWGKVAVVNPGVESATMVYNEAKIDALKQQYNLAQKTVLLTVGRLTKRKGVDKALEALKLAKKEAPELVFFIIGQGEEGSRLRSKIADLGLRDSAFILSEVDDEEKMNWYKLSDIFIMTARQIGPDVEGFGIVYLEAGLAGKPVIAGASGGVADAVTDNVNGLLVDPNDPEQIAEAMIKLAKYPSLRNRLGDAGRQRALKDFNWQNQAQKIYQHLTNI